MNALALSVIPPTDADRSRTCDRSAEQAYNELKRAVDWLECQPDDPGLRVHCLFARLYLYDTKCWISKLNTDENSEFLKLFLARFLDAYFRQVVDVMKGHRCNEGGNWSDYFIHARKLSMRSNIFSHLLVIITALKTHICHDITTALHQSAQDYEELFGHPVDLVRNRGLFFDPANRMVFHTALLEFIAFHRTHHSAFRRMMLGLFSQILGVTVRLWWPVLNSWRSSSWERFQKQMG